MRTRISRAVLVVFAGVGAFAAEPPSLDFERRVRAEEAIERVWGNEGTSEALRLADLENDLLVIQDPPLPGAAWSYFVIPIRDMCATGTPGLTSAGTERAPPSCS